MKGLKICLLAMALMAVAGSAWTVDEWTVYTNSNEIHAIAFEGDNVWCGTYGGALCLNRNNGNMVKYTSQKDGLNSNRIEWVTVDANGDKWFSTYEGGACCLSGNSWSVLENTVGNEENGLKAMLLDENGVKWIMTDYTLRKYNGKEWTRIALRNTPYDEGSGYVYHGGMIKDNCGVIWMAAAGNLQSYDGTKVTNWTSLKGYTGQYTLGVAVDRNGIIWTGAKSGVYSYDGVQWKHYTTADGLVNDAVYAVVTDLDNVLWFGTAAGVSSFDGTTWKSYTTADGLSDNMVWSVAVDGNNTKWFGTQNGLTRFDGANWKKWVNDNEPACTNVFAIVQQGNISWFGTGYGVSRFDGTTWKTYNTSDGLINDGVSGLALDKEGYLWAGTNKGISVFDGNSWKTSYTTADGLVNERVYAVLVDHNDIKWFGTQSGISSFDGVSWKSYKAPAGPAHNHITSIAEDADGVLWFGTEGGGVSSFDGTTWKSYNDFDGLCSIYIYSIVVDKNNVKWFGGLGGVSRFDGSTFTTYYSNNSPIKNNVMSMVVAPDGTIWFGTIRLVYKSSMPSIPEDYQGIDGLATFDGKEWKIDPLPIPTGTLFETTALSFDAKGSLWAATLSGLYQRGGSDQKPTAVAEALPAGFALTGNYPNPFNPSTTISFTLPSSGAAALSIYSITGQKIRDLVNGPLSAGAHSVAWDGLDDSGKAVSSGVYLSRLVQGNLTATGRMLLAK